MRRDLRGRVILVTGASRGIGRRTAERLASLGARLIVTSRSGDELDELVRKLKSQGTDIVAIPGDLTVAADRKRIVKTGLEHFGQLDVLINAAGVCSFGEFATSSEEINRKVLEVNFFAPIEMIRLCQPHLTESEVRGFQPAIVNLASICGRCGIPSMPEHCASKHAFVGMTEALRAEFQRFGIDVLLVLPGVVRSDDLNRHLLRNEGRIYLDFEGAQPPEEVADSLVNSLVRNRTEAAVGFVSWWVWFGKRIWPRGVRRIMRRKCEKFEARERARLQPAP